MPHDPPPEPPAWLADALGRERPLLVARARSSLPSRSLALAAGLSLLAVGAGAAAAAFARAGDVIGWLGAGAFALAALALLALAAGALWRMRPTPTWLAPTPTRFLVGREGRVASLPWSAFTGEVVATGRARGSLRLGLADKRDAAGLAAAGADASALLVAGRDGMIRDGAGSGRRRFVERPPVAHVGVSLHALPDPWRVGRACLDHIPLAAPAQAPGAPSPGQAPDAVRDAWDGRVDAVARGRPADERGGAILLAIVGLGLALILALPVSLELQKPEPNLLGAALLGGGLVLPLALAGASGARHALRRAGWIVVAPLGLLVLQGSERSFTPWSLFTTDVRLRLPGQLVLRRRRHASDPVADPVVLAYAGLDDPNAMGRAAAARISQAQRGESSSDDAQAAACQS